jgi:hypothetical protein
MCCAIAGASGAIKMLFTMGELLVEMISTSKKLDDIKMQFSALPMSENDLPTLKDKFGLELATPKILYLPILSVSKLNASW